LSEEHSQVLTHSPSVRHHIQLTSAPPDHLHRVDTDQLHRTQALTCHSARNQSARLVLKVLGDFRFH